jgi:thiol-disulfide isomerase/thioredoxin
MARFGIVLVGLLLILTPVLSTEEKKQVGQPAPEITGKDLNTDKVFRLSDFKGKVVVLEFWGEWCHVCKKMIPYNKELIQRMQGKPFVFVGVNTDKKRDKAVESLKSHGLTTMPCWWRKEVKQDVSAYEVRAFPTYIIIDQKAIVRNIIAGGASKKIDEAVNALVEKHVGKKKKG